MECTIENKKLIPLSKVVNSSLIDTYADIGKMEQRTSHWAARGLKKLYVEALPKLRHKVWLNVNANTHTATLPLDFDTETWVGFVDSCWRKVPLKLNTRITDRKHILDIPCDDTKCTKCGQDTSICNDLVITETTNLIVINDSTYEETITKKLYPNGDYYLETSTPYYDIETANVIYPSSPKREFITNFDLKPCGCLETSEANITNLQNYCPETYCNYYAACETNCCTDYGGYKIFEESGLMQLDSRFPYDRIYLEYNGFISKIKGQYYVPYVAFETLVEWTKYKQIQNKMNVPSRTILMWLENYKRERRNMEKNLGRASLSHIIQAVIMAPKFDVDYGIDWYCCFTCDSASAALAATAAASISIPTTPVSPDCPPGTQICQTSYILSVKVDGNVGSPVAGLTTYQNNILRNALDVHYIIAAKAIETIKDGDFTFDSLTGTVDRSPNIWVTGDTLIIHYNKNTDCSGECGGTPDPTDTECCENEIIYFYDVPTYDIPWTPVRMALHGLAANFSVEIIGDDGVTRTTVVEITPDDIVNTTSYHFDFGGNATGRIIF